MAHELRAGKLIHTPRWHIVRATSPDGQRQMDAAEFEKEITEDEIWQALKTIRADKSPRINGLPYEEYLTSSHMFVSLLAILCNKWMKWLSIR